jgi:hypothetical protein
MSGDAIRNAIAALGVTLALGGGVISVKVDIATLTANVAMLQTTVTELKLNLREIERGATAQTRL